MSVLGVSGDDPSGPVASEVGQGGDVGRIAPVESQSRGGRVPDRALVVAPLDHVHSRRVAEQQETGVDAALKRLSLVVDRRSPADQPVVGIEHEEDRARFIVGLLLVLTDPLEVDAIPGEGAARVDGNPEPCSQTAGGGEQKSHRPLRWTARDESANYARHVTIRALWPRFADNRLLAGLWSIYWSLVVLLLALVAYQLVAASLSSSSPVKVGRITHEDIVAEVRALEPTPIYGTGWWNLVVRPEELDPDSLELTFTARPAGVGIENQLDALITRERDVLIYVAVARIASQGRDAASSEYAWTYGASDLAQPPIRLTVRPIQGTAVGFGPSARNSLFAYPFDTWGYAARFSLGTRAAGADEQTFAVQSVLPCFQDGGRVLRVEACEYVRTTELEGFRLTIQPDSFASTSDADARLGFASRMVENGTRGQVGVHILLERSVAERAYVVLVLLALATTIISVWRVLFAVRNRYRPPTGEILVWVAALTFAIIAVRNNLPIPLGVGVDYLFVPMLLFSALATVELATYWTVRPDYDSEEEDRRQRRATRTAPTTEPEHTDGEPVRAEVEGRAPDTLEDR
jgi:hypothetical protein